MAEGERGEVEGLEAHERGEGREIGELDRGRREERVRGRRRDAIGERGLEAGDAGELGGSDDMERHFLVEPFGVVEAGPAGHGVEVRQLREVAEGEGADPMIPGSEGRERGDRGCVDVEALGGLDPGEGAEVDERGVVVEREGPDLAEAAEGREIDEARAAAEREPADPLEVGERGEDRGVDDVAQLEPVGHLDQALARIGGEARDVEGAFVDDRVVALARRDGGVGGRAAGRRGRVGRRRVGRRRVGRRRVGRGGGVGHAGVRRFARAAGKG
jgi:hypothetical protein